MSIPYAFVPQLSSGVTFHLREGVKVRAEDLVDFKTTAADSAFVEISQKLSDLTILGLKHLSQTKWPATLADGNLRQIDSAGIPVRSYRDKIPRQFRPFLPGWL